MVINYYKMLMSSVRCSSYIWIFIKKNQCA